MLKFKTQILEQVAQGKPLPELLNNLCRQAEEILDTCSCAIVSVDPAGMIHPVAAPSFPTEYREALDGILIGPEVGSCGSAIYHNRQVTAEDIEHDVRWTAFKQLALPLGYQACSSHPIRDEDDKPVGAIAFYLREKRALSPDELALLHDCADACALAFASHERFLKRESRVSVDPLTELPNGPAFDEALLQLPCELPGSWGLFIVDIDNLKFTNDNFGHQAGNALIRAVGERIARVVAPDRVFRTGGDEFTVLLRNEQALADLYGTADRIQQAIYSPLAYQHRTFLPRATIGGAVLAPADVKPVTVRRNADFALYHAKQTCQGGFVRFWPGIGSRRVYRRDAVRDVTQALEEGRIDLRYQPIVDLDSGLIVGFEALSCMRNPAGRIVPAAVFQEAFADARISAALTERALSRAARDARSWIDAGRKLQHIGINVTSADFYFGSLLSKIRAAFSEWDVPLDMLVVEVNEDAYLGQRDQIVATGIRELKRAGITVALDDFGTGFAALTHLLTVPVDTLKIERSFISRLAPDHPGTAIVRGILQIAADLGKAVVAEGVETHEQLDLLAGMGCAMVQGYIFSKPVEAEVVPELLRFHGAGNPGAIPLPPQENVTVAQDIETMRVTSGPGADSAAA